MALETHGIAELLQKKAFEIAYALFCIAKNSESAEFGNYLESYGLALLDSAGREDGNSAKTSLSAIRKFAEFGAGVGILNQDDADVLCMEVNSLYSAIGKFGNDIAELPNLGIAELFTGTAEEKIPNKIASPNGSSAVEPFVKAVKSEEKESSSAVENRHKMIIERVRQIGDCGIKDLQDFLPDVSERTLRYDLQELVKQNKLDKLGIVGPSVSYRMAGEGGEQFSEDTADADTIVDMPKSLLIQENDGTDD